MDSRSARRTVFTWLLLCIGTLGFTPATRGEEPARAFLEGLRKREYFDTALEYLNGLESSPLAPASIKEVLLYERALILSQGSRQQRDLQARAKTLDDAQTLLQQFLKEKPGHPLALEANTQLAALFVERARLKMELASRPQNATSKPVLMREARSLFDDSQKAFERAKTELKQKLEALKTAAAGNDDAGLAQRNQLNEQYVNARLLSAAVREEAAATEPANSKAANDLLTQAATEYKEIYEDYRTLVAGSLAKLYHGRCLLKLGQTKLGLGALVDLLEQSEKDEVLRKIRVRAASLAVEGWLKEKKLDEAIKRGADVVASATSQDAADADWLELRLGLAKAFQARGELDLKNKRDFNEARQLYLSVARVTASPLAEEAKKLIATLPGAAAVPEKAKPNNFAAANTAGREALGVLQGAEARLKELPAEISEAKEAPLKAELQKELAENRIRVADSQLAAFELFTLALTLVEKETPTEDVAAVYYFLCYLHYVQGDAPDAAVIGDFVAQRFPQTAFARNCAKVSLASYLKMYQDAKEGPTKGLFEANRVIETAKYTSERWPDQPEAQEAFSTLVPFLVKLGRLAEAQAVVAKIPADSPRRGYAELTTGQALWEQYLVGLAPLRQKEQAGKTPAAELKAERDRLDGLKKAAETTLANGIDRMRKADNPEASLAGALLAVTQIQVETASFDKAIVLLEDPKLGVLTLVRAKNAATLRPGFADEVRKLALRAYIGALPTAKNTEEVIKKAEEVVNELKTTVGASEGGADKLIGIYVSLARKLQDQMKVATPDSKAALAKGFDTFLGRVGEGTKDFQLLNWVAETYFTLGEADFSQGEWTPASKKYFEAALKGFTRLVEMAEKREVESKDPEMLLLQLRLRRALTLRRLGQFKEALDIYELILKEKNMLLNLQLEAARALMEQGEAGDIKGYDGAAAGARKDPKRPDQNIIWGWARLSLLTARDVKYVDTFHESRLGLAKAYFKYAQKQDTAAKKTKYYVAAKSVLEKTVPVYPDLGGEKWRSQYDALLKEIQTALKEKPRGLAALSIPEAAGGGPAKAGAGGAPQP